MPDSTPEPAPDRGGEQTDRLQYLDVATRRIARGMDLDETLRELRRAAVPAFADAIIVHLHDPLPVGDEKSAAPVVLQLHSVSRKPEAPATSGAPLLKSRPRHSDIAERVRPDTAGRLSKLLLTGRPAFGDAPGIAPAVAELLGPLAGVPEAIPPGRRLIIAPLHGRRHVMGTVVLLRRPERSPFTRDDLLVASQLATHTAIGVQKAVMYGHEASVADTLQHTMLPSSLPEPTGIRLASRYLPASKTAQVGGDWYDAIPLPGNRVALIVGDVMGHSMTSAAIMGQLRTIVQTLAGLDLPPDEVLHHLDEQAQRLGSDHIATCLYAIYDPISHRLLIANAGHPPAVLLHPDGHGEVLRVPRPPPSVSAAWTSSPWRCTRPPERPFCSTPTASSSRARRTWEQASRPCAPASAPRRADAPRPRSNCSATTSWAPWSRAPGTTTSRCSPPGSRASLRTAWGTGTWTPTR